MQKVYVTEEQKEKFMEKLNRDVEVGHLLTLFKRDAVVAHLRHTAAASARQGCSAPVVPFQQQEDGSDIHLLVKEVKFDITI